MSTNDPPIAIDAYQRRKALAHFFEMFELGELGTTRDGTPEQWRIVERLGLVDYDRNDNDASLPNCVRLTEKGRRVMVALELLRDVNVPDMAAIFAAWVEP